MDISPFEIYLILQADAVRGALLGAALIFVLVIILWTIFGTMMTMEGDVTSRFAKGVTGLLLAGLVFCGVASAVFPSTNTLVAMFGLPAAIDAVAALDGAEQIPQNTVDALNRLLEGVGKE